MSQNTLKYSDEPTRKYLTSSTKRNIRYLRYRDKLQPAIQETITVCLMRGIYVNCLKGVKFSVTDFNSVVFGYDIC